MTQIAYDGHCVTLHNPERDDIGFRNLRQTRIAVGFADRSEVAIDLERPQNHYKSGCGNLDAVLGHEIAEKHQEQLRDPVASVRALG